MTIATKETIRITTDSYKILSGKLAIENYSDYALTYKTSTGEKTSSLTFKTDPSDLPPGFYHIHHDGRTGVGTDLSDKRIEFSGTKIYLTNTENPDAGRRISPAFSFSEINGVRHFNYQVM